jgi:hypothetical protein
MAVRIIHLSGHREDFSMEKLYHGRQVDDSLLTMLRVDDKYATQPFI